jgi:WD40 repeat protein
VAFSSDNLKIVSGSWDNCIKIWDAVSGQLLNTLIDSDLASFSDYQGEGGLGSQNRCRGSHTDRVYCVSFSPDNSRIVSGSGDCCIKIWDAHSGQLLNTFPPDESVISSYNASTGSHHGSVLSVAFSPDNLRFVSGGVDCPAELTRSLRRIP